MCAEKLKIKKEENLIDWYNAVLLGSEMVDFSEVKGFAVYRPYGYSMWELEQRYLDAEFKSLGVENTYFPLLIPERILNKEKEHVEGFNPEVAWVTKGGDRELDEKLAIRPTSETIMYDSYSRWIKSYRDLPLLLNQWNTMVRWETKETRFLLRGRENLWQEGHCVFSSEKEAEKNALDVAEIYKKFMEEVLAVPALIGKKSEGEKFAGAFRTYTIECVLPNNFTSQAATTHELGQNFSKTFEIKFLDEKNSWKYVYQTSWGTSLRPVGIAILVHGDDNGLILPPNIAPIQAVIIPIFKGTKKDKEIIDYAKDLEKELSRRGIRVFLDAREIYSAGWKLNEYDMKGVPIKIEIGDREVASESLFIKTRFTKEKYKLARKETNKIKSKLVEIQQKMLEATRKDMQSRIKIEKNREEFVSQLKDGKAVLKVAWCGQDKCEKSIKELTGATSRLISLEKEKLIDKECIFCGDKAVFNAYFAQAY
jgi:prolyl-tRNA synthetase